MLADSSNARNNIESRPKTRIRYVRKQVQSQTDIEKLSRKRDFAMLANNSKARKQCGLRVEHATLLCSQTARKPENNVESLLTTRIRYARKQLEHNIHI